MSTISEIFGTMVFDDKEMKKRLPEDIYNSIQNTIKNGKHLDLTVANVVAKFAPAAINVVFSPVPIPIN